MTVVNLRTLVLNSNFMPVSLWETNGSSSSKHLMPHTMAATDAITDYLNGTRNVLHFYDRKILTPSRNDLYWPSIIVNRNDKLHKQKIRLKDITLFYRDNGKCWHCGCELTLSEMTFEHLVPTSKGGTNTWDNVTAACSRCNRLKGDQLPRGKWAPKRPLYEPTYYDLLEKRKKFPIIVHDEKWVEFLPKWSGEIIVQKPKPRNFVLH